MARAFADTGYWIALANPSDQWHKAAKNALREAEGIVTTSNVIDETVTLLQWRGQFSVALEFLDRARADTGLLIVYPDADAWSESWRLLRKYGGGGASAVDCLSFAVMRRLGLKRALTFDKHFRTAGFSTL